MATGQLPGALLPVLFCQQKLRARGRAMSIDGTMNGESGGIGGRREAGKMGRELKSARPPAFGWDGGAECVQTVYAVGERSLGRRNL